MLALTETKLKGNKEGVELMASLLVLRCKELGKVWHSAVVDYVRVSSRILWIKFTFSRVKVCVVVLKREMFWNDMDKTLDSVGNGYRLCILGDING